MLAVLFPCDGLILCELMRGLVSLTGTITRDPREPEDTFLDHGFAGHGFGRLPRYPTCHALGLAQFHLCYIGGFFCSFVSFARVRDGTNPSAAPPVGLLAS
jgi:hypothetical protein